MPRTRKLFLMMLIGVWIIQVVSCTPSSDISPGESEAEQTLEAIYAEQTAQAEATGEIIQPSPTPLPTPRPNGELLFSDDCDSSGGARAMFDSILMNFAYSNGKCQITANSNSDVLPAMYDAPILKDFIIEYDVEIISAKPKVGSSVIFRSDDVPGGLFSYYRISLRPVEKVIEFSVWKENKWVLHTESDISQEYFLSEEPTRVRLEVLENEFRVFLDGIFVQEYLDDQIPTEGIMGISISSYNAPETFNYDNLQVFDIGH